MKLIQFIILVGVTASIGSAASFEIYKISNLNAEYFYPFGEGRVNYVETPQLNLPDLEDDHEISIENNEGKLVFNIGNPSSPWADAPSISGDYDQFILRDFSWFQEDSSLSISLGYLYAQAMDLYRDSFTKIEGVDLKCSATQSRKKIETKSQFYNACATSGQLKIKIVEQVEKAPEEGERKTFSRVFFESLQVSPLMRNLEDQVTWYKDIEAVIKKTKFSLRLTVADYGGTRITIRGRLNYNVEEKILGVKIDSAKAGIFSVKSRLFNGLKENESETFKVEPPYFYLHLEKDNDRPDVEI